jgi:hypothetical protein
MTLDQFVEHVTNTTGFCVTSAEAIDRTVTVTFDTEVDGENAVKPEMKIGDQVQLQVDDLPGLGPIYSSGVIVGLIGETECWITITSNRPLENRRVQLEELTLDI